MADIQNMATKITENSTRIREYIKRNPGCELDDLAANIGINKNSVLRLLTGMKDDTDIFNGSSFSIKDKGKPLSIKDVEKYVDSLKGKTKGEVKPAERLLYLYQFLHNAIPDGGVTLEQLIKKYEHITRETKKLGAWKRMIYRDLDELERMEIGINRPSTGSTRYCLAEAYLPKLELESAAAVYIGMMVFRDTVLGNPTDLARKEITKAFFKGRVKNSDQLSKRFMINADTLADPQKYGNKVGTMVKAIVESFAVKIEYVKVSGDTSSRVVQPLGMMCKRGVWYLVAREHKTSEPKAFRVDQIEMAIPRETERFDYPKEFSLEKYLGDSWGIYTNDRVQKVVLKFSPEVARRVKNLKYHRSQTIADEGQDGSLIVEYNVCGLVEMKTWIMQWGAEVEVLKPKSLRTEVRKSAEQIIKKYKDK